MHDFKKSIIYFILGAILSSSLWGIFVFSGNNRDSKYKEKYEELRTSNRELAAAIRDREKTIRGIQFSYNKLKESNRRFEASIDQRAAIINETGKLITGTNDSIFRLEQIIYSFQKLEQIWIADSDS